MDESFPSRVTLECTCKGLKFAPTFPCMFSPYVPVYLRKSVSAIPVDRHRFLFSLS